ncbi:SemiSWEET family transporter [Paenibacillus sp. TRM 82003]|uniref:SemiSWEET family transporter n=1 Tax=Kineococcus sp. TRM81007 TaxID=2925831 RepID=UPI001F57562E|nr:SemiSWEET family transporter [Kineococcus sp. TRM81007]MCI2239236.1 SemiSWEET family transporter [Kineococcus sp. TRM81007]MCI3924918.1 SemiSWEET family transporter [Paenibacillus sp. TRM 82003]
MPLDALISSLGLLAASVGIVTGVPQLVHLVRSPDASGLSFSSSVLGVLGAGTWLTYGLLLMDPAQLLGNVPGLACAAATAVLAARRLGVPLSRGLAAVAAWVPAVFAAHTAGGAALVGALATAVSLVRMVPQVRTAFGSGSLTGLAPGTYVLTQVSATLWTVYGLATAQPSVVVCSVVSALLAGVVLSRRLPPRHVVRALHAGRFGLPGQLLVRPLIALVRPGVALAA